MGGFLGYDSNSQDNSTKISTVQDSYNTTTSFTQGFEDIGTVKVTLPTTSTLENFLPIIIVALVMVGLVALGGRKT